jgi:hypothetical protein
MFEKQHNVKTRCPGCKTDYVLLPTLLQDTHGAACCAKCGEIFNAFDHQVDCAESTAEEAPHLIAPPMFTEQASSSSDKNAKPKTGYWRIPLIALLSLLLFAQLLWLYRASLLHLSIAQPLCQWVDCRALAKRAPESFQVIEREMRYETKSSQSDVLFFALRFRNDAPFAQPLPGLLLHLFDHNEYLVARRRLEPDQYLPGMADLQVEAGEIIDVQLAFADPGERASGFKIDFL